MSLGSPIFEKSPPCNRTSPGGNLSLSVRLCVSGGRGEGGNIQCNETCLIHLSIATLSLSVRLCVSGERGEGGNIQCNETCLIHLSIATLSLSVRLCVSGGGGGGGGNIQCIETCLIYLSIAVSTTMCVWGGGGQH